MTVTKTTSAAGGGGATQIGAILAWNGTIQEVVDALAAEKIGVDQVMGITALTATTVLVIVKRL